MSLNVSDELLQKAEKQDVTLEDFIGCIQESLPYAWKLFAQAKVELNNAEAGPGIVNPTDITTEEHGQLLRALSSDAIRGAVETHFGYRLAFQNCCKVAAFDLSALESEKYKKFTSVRAQILNQSEALVDC